MATRIMPGGRNLARQASYEFRQILDSLSNQVDILQIPDRASIDFRSPCGEVLNSQFNAANRCPEQVQFEGNARQQCFHGNAPLI